MNKTKVLKKKRKFPVRCEKCGLIYARNLSILHRYVIYFCENAKSITKLTKMLKQSGKKL